MLDIGKNLSDRKQIKKSAKVWRQWGTTALITVLLLAGCVGKQEDVTEEPLESIVSEDEVENDISENEISGNEVSGDEETGLPVNEDSTDISDTDTYFVADQNDVYKLFYGTWEITDVVMQHRNQGDKGYEDILGMQVTYLPEMYGFGGIVKVNNPNYLMSIVPFGHSFVSDMPVGSLVNDEWFIFVQIVDKPSGDGVITGIEYGYEPYIGSEFFIKDDSTIYCFDYNCYYEMKRISYISDYDSVYDRIEGAEIDASGHHYAQNSAYKLFYGTWEVTSVISEHRLLGGDEGYEDVLNTQITYLPEYYEYSDGIRIDDPDYLISILPMSEVYLSSQEQSINAILPENDYVVYIQIAGLQNLGSEFFLKDDNTLYCVANNCIYELTRESYMPDYDPYYDTDYQERW